MLDSMFMVYFLSNCALCGSFYTMSICQVIAYIFPYEQTLSPQAKGLFQRAIFQSGVGIVGAYTTNHPLGYAKVLYM